MKANIGKNTLGDSNKMSVSLREYGRSTHNLSSAWRSPMGVGTLVPFMKLVGLPGDTFDIDLDTRIMTHPTIGPLFGNFKFQADVFTCPIRLYNAMLHNNTLNIGLDMSKVKLPKAEFFVKNKGDKEGKNGDFPDWLIPAIINDMKLQKIRNLETADGLATALYGIYINDRTWEEELSEIEKFEKITKQEVVDFAQKFFQKNYVIVKTRIVTGKQIGRAHV